MKQTLLVNPVMKQENNQIPDIYDYINNISSSKILNDVNSAIKKFKKEYKTQWLVQFLSEHKPWFQEQLNSLFSQYQVFNYVEGGVLKLPGSLLPGILDICCLYYISQIYNREFADTQNEEYKKFLRDNEKDIPDIKEFIPRQNIGDAVNDLMSLNYLEDLGKIVTLHTSHSFTDMDLLVCKQAIPNARIGIIAFDRHPDLEYYSEYLNYPPKSSVFNVLLSKNLAQAVVIIGLPPLYASEDYKELLYKNKALNTEFQSVEIGILVEYMSYFLL